MLVLTQQQVPHNLFQLHKRRASRRFVLRQLVTGFFPCPPPLVTTFPIFRKQPWCSGSGRPVCLRAQCLLGGKGLKRKSLVSLVESQEQIARRHDSQAGR